MQWNNVWYWMKAMLSCLNMYSLYNLIIIWFNHFCLFCSTSPFPDAALVVLVNLARRSENIPYKDWPRLTNRWKFPRCCFSDWASCILLTLRNEKRKSCEIGERNVCAVSNFVFTTKVKTSEQSIIYLNSTIFSKMFKLKYICNVNI